jgi:hypothetical protein
MALADYVDRGSTARRTAAINTEIRKRTAKQAHARVTACELHRKSPCLTLTDGAGGPLPDIPVGAARILSQANMKMRFGNNQEGSVMLTKLAIALVAAVSLGVAAIPTGAMAAHRGGGGGGHGGGGGGHFGGGAPGGGRSFSGGPGFSGRGMPGGNALVNRGVGSNPFVSRGVSGNPLVGRGVPSAASFVARRVSGDHRFAFIGNRRVLSQYNGDTVSLLGYFRITFG